jgi:enterochelin esterase-like enzyme
MRGSPVPSGAPASSSSSAPPAGDTRTLEVPSRPLRARVELTLWTPGVADGTPLPLLVVHDGPEYEAKTGLTGIVAGLADAGEIAPHRIALLAPGPRDEWYSASAFYARALANEVVPAIGRAVAVEGPPVGLGASLGGLAMLHAQRRHPDAFGGLFLQSASFFIPRYDHMEKDFGRYGRIVRFVRGIIRDEAFDHPVPATLTCGRDEDNLHNNRRVAAALKLQGYDTDLHEAPGGHDWEPWRAGLEAHLGTLLARTG